jgi:hypothetical protein
MDYMDSLLIRVFLDTHGKQTSCQRLYLIPPRPLSSQPGRRIMASLGKRLVAIGTRLEQCGRPQHGPELVAQSLDR